MTSKVAARITAWKGRESVYGPSAPDLRAGFPYPHPEDHGDEMLVSMRGNDGKVVELPFDVGDLEDWCRQVIDTIHRRS